MLALCAGLLSLNASANSISFDSSSYIEENGGGGAPGSVFISVLYDFTDFPMFGGGFDIVFDPAAVQFSNYIQAPLPDDAEAAASPVGMLNGNVYQGAGIGTFDFFNGMSGAGTIGTFEFIVLSAPSSGSKVTPCGFVICLVSNEVNPFVSLNGDLVSDELLMNGITSVENIYAMPVPAAVWFMLSGLGALAGFGRKST